MNLDRAQLELAAPALCTVGSLIALLATLFGSGRTKSGVLSALLGTIGSAAWLAAALEAQNDAPASDVGASTA
ncbi:MAG: hypothetical protein AAFP84_21800 [Actinomycetota bacterium]